MIKREDYLNVFYNYLDTDFIKIIIGLRRCGKTTFLKSIIEELKGLGIADENIIYISLENVKYRHIKTSKELDEVVLDKVKDKSIEEKIYFLAPYIPYLLAVLNDFSAVEDAYAYDDRFRNNETIAFIIVYRYEHNISVLDDLRLEKSGEDACKYHSKIVDRLIDEKYAKINELKKYKPEEYQKYLNNWRKENQRIKEIVNEIRSGFLNN
jgi:AAA+ ATPase superfamily predicted ATPase